jgi:hypothetical protein
MLDANGDEDATENKASELLGSEDAEEEQDTANIPGVGICNPQPTGHLVASLAAKLAMVPKPSFTLSGYLNAVDGFLKLQEACVLIDTNHPELLDAAVKRCGRVTYHIDLGKEQNLQRKREEAGTKQANELHATDTL